MQTNAFVLFIYYSQMVFSVFIIVTYRVRLHHHSVVQVFV